MMPRSSSIARLPAARMPSAASRTPGSEVATASAPACSTIRLTWCETTSCISAARRLRSSARARSVSSARSRSSWRIRSRRASPSLAQRLREAPPRTGAAVLSTVTRTGPPAGRATAVATAT
ncbi:hypothetical protein HFP72_00880 [Nocardiopsis sp. ARC36]